MLAIVGAVISVRSGETDGLDLRLWRVTPSATATSVADVVATDRTGYGLSTGGGG